LYQYSLRFILDIFQVVLSSNPHLKGVSDHHKRLSIITTDMFQVRTDGTLYNYYSLGGFGGESLLTNNLGEEGGREGSWGLILILHPLPTCKGEGGGRLRKYQLSIHVCYQP
jgi:hypothetical protein